MSTGSWARLAAPFAAAAIAWHAVSRDADGTRLRLAPHLSQAALRARLDEVVGPDAWSLRLVPWGDGGLVGELTVMGATRAGAVRVATSANDATFAEVSAAAAWSAAASGFGMVPPVQVTDDGWVEADPESGEPLHLPETVAAGRSGDAGATGTLATSTSTSTSTTAVDPEATPATAAGAGDAGTADGGTAAPKPEAQRMIDRLMERLREEGLGSAAAKLVTSYGGYGRDPRSSRELYARLRALLIDRSGPT